jgi:hypothetical protein
MGRSAKETRNTTGIQRRLQVAAKIALVILR